MHFGLSDDQIFFQDLCKTSIHHAGGLAVWLVLTWGLLEASLCASEQLYQCPGQTKHHENKNEGLYVGARTE